MVQLKRKTMATFKATFKETYMPHAVTRICEVPTEEDVRRFYNLDDDDIEWYKIERIF